MQVKKKSPCLFGVLSCLLTALCAAPVLLPVLISAQLFAQVRTSAESKTPARQARQQLSVRPEAMNITSLLRTYIRSLASDEFEGRAPGTAGGNLAQAYIVNQFKKIGVRPLPASAHSDGISYIQPFLYRTDMKLGMRNSCAIESRAMVEGMTNMRAVPPINMIWTVGQEYMPFGFSHDTTVTGDMIFCGYGISVAEVGYDDYANIDVQGKIVIVLAGTPEPNNPHSKFAEFENIRRKALNAREHGAALLIVVEPSAEQSSSVQTMKVDRTGSGGIGVISANHHAVNQLLYPDKPVAVLHRILQETKQPQSFAVSSRMTISVDVDAVESPTGNVMGFIPGTDPRRSNEYIVIGAHYDHLGYGGENSLYAGKDKRIHFGADDNASGTAGMLVLAERIARKPLSRPVIVLAFSGEESGLLGSAWFCKYSPVPLSHMIAMINLDMIGRMSNNQLSVMGTGTSPIWDGMLDTVSKQFKVRLAKTADGFGPSDHASFYAKDIPVLHFFTSLHEDYHRPTDTFDKIKYADEERVLRMVETIVQRIAFASQRPVFSKVASSATQRTGGFRVFVGTIPDYGDHPKGMKISGVREGSPAQKAGLKEGDILIEFGGQKITNVYDYTYALGRFKAGEKVMVIVLRGSAEDLRHQVELTLEGRR